MVGEFPATRSRPRRVTINYQILPPECVLVRDQGEELVGATEREHIPNFTER